MTCDQSDYGNCRVRAVGLAPNEERTIADAAHGAARLVHDRVIAKYRPPTLPQNISPA